VKPEIDGGFILQMDDKEYDASVRTQLNNIKEKLINTAVVNE
jgi:F0F1-type ATP synthase delta subunit